jgi:hypothetical protein
MCRAAGMICLPKWNEADRRAILNFFLKPSVSLLKCKRTLVLRGEWCLSEALAKDVLCSLAERLADKETGQIH